jgi:hypothetical protein
MQTTRHTRIDDLTTFGYELSEGHLVMAVGGRISPNTYIRTYERASGDVAADYYA